VAHAGDDVADRHIAPLHVRLVERRIERASRRLEHLPGRSDTDCVVPIPTVSSAVVAGDHALPLQPGNSELHAVRVADVQHQAADIRNRRSSGSVRSTSQL
jgi:hypothetical protein